MPDRLIKEEVDIYLCPATDQEALSDVGDTLTIGDLHGNAIKLLFLVTKHGIAQDMTENVYTQLVSIYEKSFSTGGVSIADLQQFKNELNSIAFKSEATIRLLGDLLADRGGNDYLTLLILHRLWTCKIKYEIILSNHDLEFLINFENPKSNFSTTQILSLGSMCRSMTALSALIDAGLTRTEIDLIIREAYLPSLKLLSYTVNEQNNEITLFSHAPIGLTNIKYLASMCYVGYKSDSLSELSHTIDKINHEFTKHVVAKGMINTLVNDTKLFDPQKDPVGHALWNRDTDNLERPAHHHGYRVRYVHGHDSGEAPPYPAHIINLDNVLGKAVYFDEDMLDPYNQGTYTLLHSGSKVRVHKEVRDSASTFFSEAVSVEDTEDLASTQFYTQETSKCYVSKS